MEELSSSTAARTAGKGEDVEERAITRLRQEGLGEALHTSSKHPSRWSRQGLVHVGRSASERKRQGGVGRGDWMETVEWIVGIWARRWERAGAAMRYVVCRSCCSWPVSQR